MKIARDKDFIGIRIFNFSITFDHDSETGMSHDTFSALKEKS